MTFELFDGFWSGVGSGLSILFPLFLICVLVLWLAMPFLLMRQTRILLEIRDLLKENTLAGQEASPTKDIKGDHLNHEH